MAQHKHKRMAAPCPKDGGEYEAKGDKLVAAMAFAAGLAAAPAAPATPPATDDKSGRGTRSK